MNLHILLLSLSIAMAADSPDAFAPPKKMMKDITNNTGCEADAIQATQIDRYVRNKIPVTSFTIEGCPQSPFILTYWVKGGNWQWYTDVDLRKKAPFDLNCAADQLSYTFIDDKNRGVEGCERRATYVLTGAGWVANVTSE
jgi:hypothetical protein